MELYGVWLAFASYNVFIFIIIYLSIRAENKGFKKMNDKYEDVKKRLDALENGGLRGEDINIAMDNWTKDNYNTIKITKV